MNFKKTVAVSALLILSIPSASEAQTATRSCWETAKDTAEYRVIAESGLNVREYIAPQLGPILGVLTKDDTYISEAVLSCSDNSFFSRIEWGEGSAYVFRGGVEP